MVHASVEDEGRVSAIQRENKGSLDIYLEKTSHHIVLFHS